MRWMTHVALERGLEKKIGLISLPQNDFLVSRILSMGIANMKKQYKVLRISPWLETQTA